MPPRMHHRSDRLSDLPLTTLNAYPMQRGCVVPALAWVNGAPASGRDMPPTPLGAGTGALPCRRKRQMQPAKTFRQVLFVPDLNLSQMLSGLRGDGGQECGDRGKSTRGSAESDRSMIPVPFWRPRDS
jgi:hypothetical protein